MENKIKNIRFLLHFYQTFDVLISFEFGDCVQSNKLTLYNSTKT